MTLKEKLTADMKDAMKIGDTLKKDTVRILRGAVRNLEIDLHRDLNEQEVLEVIGKQAKQRRDSIFQYQQANRPDLVKQEEMELEIIEAYLPQQLSDEEITLRADAVIKELGSPGMKGMGQVMQRLTADLKGVADGKRISSIVRQLLGR